MPPGSLSSCHLGRSLSQQRDVGLRVLTEETLKKCVLAANENGELVLMKNWSDNIAPPSIGKNIGTP